MSLSEFAGCRIGILGAGVEGRAAWRHLCERLPRQLCEVFSEGAVDPAFAAELAARGHALHQGALAASELATFDLLIRSPGVSPYREALQGARAAGVRFTTATNLWFAEHPRARVMCITGTKGKSTTTALVRHLLRAAGIRAEAAGNLGRPLLDMAADDADWWVVELSSYQLCDFEGRPRLAAILNLSEDHTDWHGGRAAYRQDKLRLAERVRGPLVANHADPVLREALAGHPAVRWFNDGHGWRVTGSGTVRGGDAGPALTVPRLRGRHNLANLAAALTLVECVTPITPQVVAALPTFTGLPHRLQILGTRHGLTFVDDSLSTTPTAVGAALDAFRGEAVTLLLGGLDRGVDWSGDAARLGDVLPHAIVALPDNGPQILAVLERHGVAVPGGMHVAHDLAEAVARAREVTPPGGTVLLSPGAPSFPHFKDYRARGIAFARAAGFTAE